MSKGKNKDNAVYDKQFEELYRWETASRIQLESLTDVFDKKKKYMLGQVKDYKKFQKEKIRYEDLIESSKQILDKEQEKLSQKKNELRSIDLFLDQEIKEIRDTQENEMAGLMDEWDKVINQIKNETINNRSKFEENWDESKAKDKLENELTKLSEDLDFEREDIERVRADKEKEKVIETHELNQNITKKIEETKISLQALKREQLETTRRLTVLQNNQLTDELEFQSKQTEKLLSKNKKLQETVTVLKREEEIHKQVETELAQRSQKAQNLITKLSHRLKGIEKERGDLRGLYKVSEEKYDSVLNTELDEDIFQMEKKLNDYHKKTLDFKRKTDHIMARNSDLDNKLSVLHKNEPGCLAVLVDVLSSLNPTNIQDNSFSEEFKESAVEYSNLDVRRIDKMPDADILEFSEYLIHKIQPYIYDTFLKETNEVELDFESSKRTTPRKSRKHSGINLLPPSRHKHRTKGSSAYKLPDLRITGTQSKFKSSSTLKFYDKGKYFDSVYKKFSELPVDLKCRIITKNIFNPVSKKFKSTSANHLPRMKGYKQFYK